MPTLELSMIVKNGEAQIARCLASTRGIVDRISIGDTGSTDDTSRIAREFGANIIYVPWQNDFAAARNAVLAQATCDWILFLDADEMLDPPAAKQIPSLIANSLVDGYDVTAWNYVLDSGFRSNGEQAKINPGFILEAAEYPAYFPSSNTRLFRRDPAIFFEHCVHETVADRIDTLQLHRKAAPFVIHHFGFVEDAEALRSGKENLYYQLALKKVDGSPESYEANLGAGVAEADHARRPAAALSYFHKAIRLNPGSAPGWLYAGICLTRLGRHAEALDCVRSAINLNPASMLAASTLGDIHFQTLSYREARVAYRSAIQLGDLSPLSLAKLGAAEVHLGDFDSGMAHIEAAIRQSPSDTELYDLYAPTAFLAGRAADACQAADLRLSMTNVSAFNFLIAATLHIHANLHHKAQRILEAGIRLFPNDAELRSLQTLQA